LDTEVRTLRSLFATPVAILVFVIGYVLCASVGIIYNNFLFSNYKVYSSVIVDIMFTCLFTYLVNSIALVAVSNFIMNLMLNGESRYLLSFLAKTFFTVFGIALFSTALAFRIYTGLELERYFLQYIITIISFIVIPASSYTRTWQG